MSLVEFANWIDQEINDAGFRDGVWSGLLVMLVQTAFTVFGVDLITKRSEKRHWEKSRQMLADVLLCSAGDHLTGVMKHFRSFLFEKDGKLMFISSIELYFARMEMSLDNLNEQMLVHLPAALPETTEKLSEMTKTIALLRGHLLALRLHLNNLNSKMHDYDPTNPLSPYVDPKKFTDKEEVGISLKDHAPRCDENYLFMSLIKVSQFSVAICESIVRFSAEYSGRPEGFPNEKNESDRARSYLRKEIANTRKQELNLRQNGLYLFRYTPTDLELDP